MKKLASLLAVFGLTLSLGACSNETAQPEETSTPEVSETTETPEVEAETAASEGNKEIVDGYTSASTTKTTLTGDALTEATTGLVAVSSDLASLATTQEEGYIAPESAAHVQILSVNPTGTVGFSTIAAWQYQQHEDGVDQVVVQLTDGQNARNLAEIGKRGSIIVHNGLYYILHLETIAVEVLEYTEENFNNGLFNYAYTGAAHQASQYNITFNVLAVESTPVALLD
ncbi:hypothetical protein [Turicibacter sanguinis]|uniref:hypothetical protein n=1 Tax=Turicibacter sanguinis TaxID=154288 RepID=UPI0021D4B0C9|nr:hypothetical protein [Turicibacter sanguinis]MCU7198016.1 hypothetical protein [Turicibacter sanguinis]